MKMSEFEIEYRIMVLKATIKKIMDLLSKKYKDIYKLMYEKTLPMEVLYEIDILAKCHESMKKEISSLLYNLENNENVIKEINRLPF